MKTKKLPLPRVRRNYYVVAVSFPAKSVKNLHLKSLYYFYKPVADCVDTSSKYDAKFVVGFTDIP